MEAAAALGNTSPPLQQSLRGTEFVMEEYWLLVVRMLVEGCVRNECRYLLDLVVVKKKGMLWKLNKT